MTKILAWLRKIGFVDFLIKTFGPNGIFSSGTEGHAFLIGISETVAFWKPRHDMPAEYGQADTASDANGHPIKREYHYYTFGRACGVQVWIGQIIGLIAILKYMFGG